MSSPHHTKPGSDTHGRQCDSVDGFALCQHQIRQFHERTDRGNVGHRLLCRLCRIDASVSDDKQQVSFKHRPRAEVHRNRCAIFQKRIAVEHALHWLGDTEPLLRRFAGQPGLVSDHRPHVIRHRSRQLGLGALGVLHGPLRAKRLRGCLVEVVSNEFRDFDIRRTRGMAPRTQQNNRQCEHRTFKHLFPPR